MGALVVGPMHRIQSHGADFPFSTGFDACEGGHRDPPLPVLLVYGGSRGARSINRAIEALLRPLLELAEIVHVCGREGDEAFLRQAAETLPPELRARYHLYSYLPGTMPKVGNREPGTGNR